MSAESAKEFLKKFAADEAFRKSIENAANDADRQNIVKEAGFNFTKDEIKAIGAESGELSEQELEKVAGGGSASWIAVGVSAAGAAAAAF